MRELVSKEARLSGVKIRNQKTEGVMPFNMKPVVVVDPKFALVSKRFAGIVDDYFKV